MIFARKIKKIPEFYMIFARKMPKFYIIIARKIFFPIFWREAALFARCRCGRRCCSAAAAAIQQITDY